MSKFIAESFDDVSRVKRAASTPTSSSSSSSVTIDPDRLLIFTTSPFRRNETNWYSTISTASGSIPSACAAPFTRFTSPWWSAPQTYTTWSKPRENLSIR